MVNFDITKAVQVADRLRDQGECEGAETIEDLIRHITVPVACAEGLDLAKHDGAVAWHLIERHAVNWADTRHLMEQWFNAELARRQSGLSHDD